ncbi:MAG: glycosyltransferase family 2 protein, partial [Pirellulales bacterium]|nr:glycosyltransferase family 2 protein [Pirellulales bacterium]
TLVESKHNGGFGYGNNLVLRDLLADHDSAEYIYLCNPDSYPEPGSTTALADYLAAHPGVGIAGGQLYDDKGEDWSSAFRFHNMLAEFDESISIGVISAMLGRWRVAHRPPYPTGRVDWVSGASFMIRREALEAIGLFDEKFFLYFEETDFCRRAKAAGWETHHVAQCRVHHVSGLSLEIDEPTDPMPDWWFESRRHYFLKHHGRIYTSVTNVACVAGLLLKKLRYAIQRKRNHSPANFLGDFIRHNFRSARRPSMP